MPPIVTVEDAQSLPVMSTKDSATSVAIEQALASEAASCVYTFKSLPVAVRKCGTPKKKKKKQKQKLNSKEALTSKEAYSSNGPRRDTTSNEEPCELEERPPRTSPKVS